MTALNGMCLRATQGQLATTKRLSQPTAEQPPSHGSLLLTMRMRPQPSSRPGGSRHQRPTCHCERLLPPDDFHVEHEDGIKHRDNKESDRGRQGKPANLRIAECLPERASVQPQGK